MISLDGYFVDANGDMNWAHNSDPEFVTFAQENAKGGLEGGGELLFGRKTYDLMVSYWPTPAAKQNDPITAEAMNNMRKVVFSRTMEKASAPEAHQPLAEWNNTTLIKDNMVERVRKMKQDSGSGMVILGSGEIISQLTQAGLIDEYQFVVIPIVLGKGRTMFEGMKNKLNLKLTKSRTFKNGNVFLCYKRAKE